MRKHAVIHERIRFGRDEYLAGVLSYPANCEPKQAVLICSPHPNFGGDMENNVVAALAERFASEAITLRFDYRGVGQSLIDLPAGLSIFDYWENLEQTLDYADPLTFLPPLNVSESEIEEFIDAFRKSVEAVR